MLQVPVFRPDFRVTIVPDEGVFLLNERRSFVLKGAGNCAIAQCIDGKRPVDEIVDALMDHYDPAELYYTLDAMERKGYLVEAHPEIPSARRAFWSLLGLESGAAEAARGAHPLSVVSIGGVDLDPVVTALQGEGCTITDGADFTLVLADDYLRPELKQYNADRLAAAKPWMLAKPAGMVIWIGPVFEPGITGCWACLAHRLSRNREVEGYLAQRVTAGQPLVTALAATPASLAVAHQLSALTIARRLAGDRAVLAGGRMLTLDLATLESQSHVLVRRPQCRECGDPSLVSGFPVPVRLASVLTSFAEDGGYRAVTPLTTIDKYRHHISPITGAVTNLEQASQGDPEFLHNYVAGHNFAYDVPNLHTLRKGLRSKSAGKGASEAQGRASALCEALERYSGLYTGDEYRERASYRHMGDRAIHPNAVMLYSDTQYSQREHWNGRGSFFQFVPEPFDEEADIDWSPLWSFTEERFRYLPTGQLYFSYPRGQCPAYFGADSNGNAAGNTLEEAILQGFMELIERDAAAVWWYNRLHRPAVDLDSFELPYLSDLQGYYTSLNREFWVLDITSDFAVPVFAAVSRRVDKPVEDIVFSFGAHPDAKIALLRAVTEMNQFLPAVLPIGVDGSGEYAFPDEEAQRWWKTATLASQPYLVPDRALARVTRSNYRDSWGGDLRDAVLRCQRIVEAQGHEFLVLNQTRPDLGLPVVKVVAPGLRHFWARFAPGRLYEVPVRMGLRLAPCDEQDLNPIPVFV